MDYVEELKAKGNSCFKNANYSESIDFYSRALQELLAGKANAEKSLSLTATLFSNRAACWLKLEKYDKCIDDCSAAIALVRDDKKSYYRRALANQKLGSFDKSSEDIKMVLYLDPKSLEGRKLLEEIKQHMSCDASSTQVGSIMKYLATDLVTWEKMIPQLISLVEDDSSKALELANNGYLSRLFLEFNKSLTSDHDSEKSLCSGCLKLVSVLLKHTTFVEKYAEFTYENDNLNSLDNIFNGNGKITLEIMKLICCDHSNVSLWAALASKNLLVSFINAKQLEKIDGPVFNCISKALSHALGMQNAQNYGAVCDLVIHFSTGNQECALPEKYPEEMTKNKLLYSQNSKEIIENLLQSGIMGTLLTNLESNSSSVRSQSMSLAGKLIRYYDNDEKIKAVLVDSFFSSGEDSWDPVTHRKLALIEAALLASNPSLGAWMLEKSGGVSHLQFLLNSFDEKSVEIAAEVISLAAGNDSAAASLTPLLEDFTIHNLTRSESTGVAVAAGSALAKLSIRSKSLTKESAENAQILNCAAAVIRKFSDEEESSVKNNSVDIPSHSVVMNSVERAVEIIAAMCVSSHAKEEIVHGSYRCKECISELLKIDISKGSSLAFGVSQIFSSLTVTNRELKLLVLADRDISVDQFEKLQELQRIKTKDENGNIIEEKKMEEDLDTQELCNKRIRRIVEAGGIEALLRIMKGDSNQAKYLSARSLRQMCVEHSVRGKFTVCGGLKQCINIASNPKEELRTRFEAAHAVAKALVTTNPNMLSDHLRMGSIHPLLLLCRESKCSQLQQFESLLALTNLLSCGENEQDKFVELKGISAVHYLIFSENIMVRRAATEALCNLSGHESLLKVLRDAENLKLWLGLAEDWDGEEDPQFSERFKTCRAAIATVAVAAFDCDVAKALFRLNFMDTVLIVLRTKNEELIQRVMFLIQQLLQNEEGLQHLQNQELLNELQSLNDNQECITIAENIKSIAL